MHGPSTRLENLLTSGAFKTVALEIEILLDGRNPHITNQHRRSPFHINLDGREFIGYRFLHGYL